jgi:hypothetical protein
MGLRKALVNRSLPGRMPSIECAMSQIYVVYIQQWPRDIYEFIGAWYPELTA